MRLLRFVDGRLTLTNFSGRTVPPYAILSHRWSEDCNDEVLFEDLGTDAWITKANSPKIVFCAGRAAEDGLEYFWIDTCCIDKWDRDELSKAVNSMFRWYQNAFKCYVYLSDVLWSSGEHAGQQRPWEAAFRESCWFKRGWTLQELIAPASVEFFTSDGQRVGDKESLEQIIHEITGIPDQALQCSSLHEFSVSDRIAWLGDRRTTEPEDAAYCLLGILNISMPLSYGEGKEKALSRLREELQATADSPSIIPFSQNERFVGREAELAEIESQLFTDKHSTRIAITGEGGTGKSQLALEIAHRLRRKNKHCSVFWVDVSSIDSLWQGYSSIAEKLKLPGWDDEKADVMELVRIHLSGEKVGQWLLVFDNVDNLDLVPAEYAKRKPTNLVNYLPQCELGCILFTTTNSKAAETLALQNIMELHEMTPETAERMLASHVIDRRLGDEKHEMQTLLYELLYLPLAIVQAAAYINITGITLKEYRSRLDKHKEEALQLYNARSIDTRQAESLRDPITSTLLTTLYQLLQDHRLASNYLFLMACIDRRDIPLNMLDTDLAKEREDAVRVLNDYALITRRPADDALDLHRLVHQTTRAWLQKQEWFSERTEKAAGRLAEIFPSDNDGSRSAFCPTVKLVKKMKFGRGCHGSALWLCFVMGSTLSQENSSSE
ncbi:HET-domain-containing protein [Lepidopterella palustris CBS 459.81]|uniref:HET-domain-containing protein n=1 Tax=Lepidopterella palustris CBS 459.81 TaxID=1314670 RepID=A0A8E2EBI9_9PEZI|nr:HET-domain-containing protein [Lepidopterella palustris CBS 459.81]